MPDPVAFTFRPNNSLAERLDWLTDVLPSGTSEMRVSARDARQSIDFSLTLRDDDLERLAWLVRSSALGDWHVPLWFEGTIVEGVTTTQTVFSVETAADYRVGGLAMVWGGCENYAVATISEIASGSITVDAEIGITATRAMVMPVRLCFVDGGLRFSRIRERGLNDAAISFTSRDAAPAGVTPFPQYLSRDLVRKCGTVEPLAASVIPPVTQIDSGLGPVALESLRDWTGARYSMNWRVRPGADLWERRLWLHSIRGRDRAFWLADWARDLNLATAISSVNTFVEVEPTLPLEAYPGRHIYLDRDGTVTGHRVTAAALVGAKHRLTLSASVGRTLSIAGTRVGFLRLVRLDSDVIELAHEVGFYSVARLPLVEVPE